jgi:hypothetical protein
MKNIQNSREFQRNLINIAFGCISLPLLIFAWLYLESSIDELEPVFKQEKTATLVLFFAAVIMLLVVFFGGRMYNKKLGMARESKTLVNKLMIYRQALIKKFLSFGIASMVIVIGFYLTNIQLFAVFFALMIILFSINNPNSRKISKDLKLKDREKEIVLKGLDLN